MKGYEGHFAVVILMAILTLFTFFSISIIQSFMVILAILASILGRFAVDITHTHTLTLTHTKNTKSHAHTQTAAHIFKDVHILKGMHKNALTEIWFYAIQIRNGHCSSFPLTSLNLCELSCITALPSMNDGYKKWHSHSIFEYSTTERTSDF